MSFDPLAITRSRISFVFLALLYRGLLDIAYFMFVSPYYSYTGLIFEPGSTMIIVLSYMLVLVTACIIPVISTRPSNFIVGFLYLVSYIPTTSLMAFGGYPILPAAWITLVFVFLFYLSNKHLKLKLNFSFDFSFGKRGELLFLSVFGFFLIAFLLLLIKYEFRLPTTILNVYDIRFEYKISMSEENRLLGYIFAWLGGIIIPFIAAWALISRKIVILSIAILAQLVVFAIAGEKSHLFAILFITWILVGIHFFRVKLLRYVAYSLIILIITTGIIDYIIIDTPVMNGVFTRRIFFIPAQLYYYYYNFFSQNLHTYLSQSNLFSLLLDYPYNLPIPNLIAHHYLTSWETNANANMWADAYASFGVFGMFIFAVLLWVLMNAIDNISENKNIYLVYTLIAMPIFSLTNTAFLTTMLTHGMLLSITLLMLLPRSQDSLLKSRKSLRISLTPYEFRSSK